MATQVSLKDVAAEAQVSRATASMALRASPAISAATRARVQAAADKLGYLRVAAVSEMMTAFRKGVPQFRGGLALINVNHFDDWLDSFVTFRHWTKSAEERAERLGYKLERFWLNDPKTHADRLCQILIARGIVGILFAGVELNGLLPEAAEPLWRHFPSVVLGVRLEQPELHCVLSDHFSSVHLAARQLLHLGYKRIGIVLWEDCEVLLNHRLYLGYISAMMDQREVERLPALELASAEPKAFHDWMDKYKPDAVLAHDPMILTWMQQPARKKKPRPYVALLDLPSDDSGQPGIWQQNDEVGRQAVEMVTAQIHRGESGPPTVATSLMIEGVWKS